MWWYHTLDLPSQVEHVLPAPPSEVQQLTQLSPHEVQQAQHEALQRLLFAHSIGHLLLNIASWDLSLVTHCPPEVPATGSAVTS